MSPLNGLFVFSLGAVVGSFLNVCIHRLPRGESIVFPSSHCPRCGAPVKPWDNIPVVSWLLLRGRCRSCRAGISPRYLLVEVLAGAAALWMCGAFAPDALMTAIALVFAWSLLVVVFVDFEHQIILDEISLGGLVFGVLASAACPALHEGGGRWGGAAARALAGFIEGAMPVFGSPYAQGAVASAAACAAGAVVYLLIRAVAGAEWKWEAVSLGLVAGISAATACVAGPERLSSLVSSLIGLLTGGGVFWVIRGIGRRVYGAEAMGFGDVKLMAYAGALMGWSMVLLATFMASLFGAGAGLLLIAARKAGLRSPLPFGPFLCAGSLIAFMYGDRIVAWYLGTICGI